MTKPLPEVIEETRTDMSDGDKLRAFAGWLELVFPSVGEGARADLRRMAGILDSLSDKA